MKVRFELGEVSTKSFTGKDGKQVTMREQECFVHQGDRYPLTTKISIKDGAQPYEPGFYQLAKGSFKANAYGGLELSVFDLKFVLEDDAKPEAKSTSKAA